jgi:transcriptional regulator with XRE-family HTH domain
VSAFCREHGFARNTVQQWLTGVRRPYDHNRVRLAKALGIGTDDLDAALDATAREAADS